MSFIEITAVLWNLGEFIGAIAVVVTLFYVVSQVKHSKEATEANIRSLEEGSKIALLDAYHARAVEKLRLRMVQMNNVYMLDASFFAYQQGLLPHI
jgi:hypothetical protein